MKAQLNCPLCGQQALTVFQKTMRGTSRPYECANCGGKYKITIPLYFSILYVAMLPAAIIFKTFLFRSVWYVSVGLLAIIIYVLIAKIEVHREPITFDS